MSLRRFAGYFLTLSAAASVAFASCMLGQPVPPEAASREATLSAGVDRQVAARTAFLFQQMQERHLHSSVAH